MPRRLRRLAGWAVILGASFWVSPTHVSARNGSGPVSSANQDTGDVNVRAVAGVLYSEGGGSSGPRCGWRRYSVGEWADATGVPRPPGREYAVPDEELTPEDLAARDAERAADAAAEERRRAEPRVTPVNGEPHYTYAVRCPGGVGNDVRLAPVNIDADDLLPGLTSMAQSRIELPVPDTSPALADPGYVNLGMWLAVEPATFTPITAEAGPHWVTLSAAHESIGFDFGNGDSTTCAGFGTPIVDPDTVEQGPCGYTYRRSSPGAPYTVTVSTTWNLTYVGSSGAGALDPFTRSSSFPHDVDELQTVGVDN